MKWLWWLATDAARAFDWYDDTGVTIDHGKVVADWVIACLLAAVVSTAVRTAVFPPVGIVIALIAGAMGSRVFIAFLRSRTVTEHDSVALTEPIARDIDVDPNADGDGGSGAAQ